jgi:hypothetical protein
MVPLVAALAMIVLLAPLGVSAQPAAHNTQYCLQGSGNAVNPTPQPGDIVKFVFRFNPTNVTTFTATITQLQYMKLLTGGSVHVMPAKGEPFLTLHNVNKPFTVRFSTKVSKYAPRGRRMWMRFTTSAQAPPACTETDKWGLPLHVAKH